MVESIIVSAAILLSSQIVFYGLALKLKNNGVADLGWGAGFPLVALGQLVLHGTPSPVQGVSSLLVLAWGLRLILLVVPRVRSGREDWRYAEMRERWGASTVWRGFTHVFLFQGLLLGAVATPILLIFQESGSGPDALDILGAALFLFGLVYETIADLQLARFIRTEKSETNRIMTQGLWRYSRHPNYFGEAVVWWGLFLIAVSAPNGWIALISPVLITFLLTRVSGIPFLERRFSDDPAFQEYKKRTSVFLPWFPKQSS